MYSEYSNAQLRRKADEIQNMFEVTKNLIESKCKLLEQLEKDYSDVMKELDNRRNIN